VDVPFSFEGNSHSANPNDGCGISMSYDEESGEKMNNEIPLDNDQCKDNFDGTSSLIGHSAVQQESLGSIVNGTQFVDVEYDTQATNSYDQSPTTQMAFQKIDQNPDEHSSASSPRNYIERQKPTVTDDVSDKFQFGPSPDPNALKLRRPPPGKAFNFSECKNPQNLSSSSDSAATGIKQGILEILPMGVELTYHPTGYSGEGSSGTNLPSRGLTRARKCSSSKETKDTVELPIPEGSTTEGRCLHSGSTFQGSTGNQKAGIIQSQKQDKSPKYIFFQAFPSPNANKSEGAMSTQSHLSRSLKPL
jgi:hypothetical protein